MLAKVGDVIAEDVLGPVARLIVENADEVAAENLELGREAIRVGRTRGKFGLGLWVASIGDRRCGEQPAQR